MFNIYLNNNSKDLLDIIGIIGQILVPLIVLCISVQYTNSRNKQLDKQFALQKQQQHEHWLKDIYMKNEAKILLEFRNMYFNASSSALWILNNLYTPRFYNDSTMKEEHSYLSIDLINKNYMQLKESFDFYFKHQMIFKKYGIGEELEYISIILETIACYLGKRGDLKYKLIKEEETVKEYQHNEYTNLVNSLVTGMNVLLFHMNLQFIDNEFKNKISNLNFNEKLNEYKNFISSKIIGLEFKLEELTLTDYNNISDSLKGISKKTLPETLI